MHLIHAHPQAQLLQVRGIHQDLNRVFPGNPTGTIEERIAERLLRLLRTMDVVIDIHSFATQSTLTAIEFADEPLIDAFGPDNVWCFASEKTFIGSLGPELTRSGIRNFAIELPELATQEDVERAAEGVRNVLRALNMLPGTVQPGKAPRMQRRERRSDHAGVFVPVLQPGTTVTTGNVVGHILSKETHAVAADHAGVLMQVRNPGFVRQGDLLAAIGGEDDAS